MGKLVFEKITPKKAEKMLEMNLHNRPISRGTVTAYAIDMKNGHWDENVCSPINIDTDGVLRDGQHRLMAVIEAGVPVSMYVFYGCSPTGIFDNNRKRSMADQLSITREDLPKVYRSSRYISIARWLITGGDRRKVTVNEITDFTDKHLPVLNGFFSRIPQTSVAKISLATVHCALFLAYCNGIYMEDILRFYDILCTGMNPSPQGYPVIAYRNHLLSSDRYVITYMEVARCQYSLYKYITKSCTKKSIIPKKMIYPVPDDISDVKWWTI